LSLNLLLNNTFLSHYRYFPDIYPVFFTWSCSDAFEMWWDLEW